MTVETNANFVSDLNKAYPRNRDLIKEGDDHIRLVKSVLQNTFPGMDGAVNADSAKLNKLDKSLTYDTDVLEINNNLKLKKDSEVDCNGTIFKNAGDPEEDQDLVTLKYLQGNAMWPIGSIFMTVSSEDPSVILGFGNWDKYAAGRVIVGSGTTTDADNDTRTTVNGAKGGSYSKKLIENNLPAHTHEATATITEGGGHSHKIISGGGSSGPRSAFAIDANPGDGSGFVGNGGAAEPRTEIDGAHNHEIKVENASTGKGEAFDVIPPFIACNIWVRVADTVTP
ncbi:MAG: phage baseplate protein [Bacteroidales bacterium]